MELTTWFTLLLAGVLMAIATLVIVPLLVPVGIAVAGYRAVRECLASLRKA